MALPRLLWLGTAFAAAALAGAGGAAARPPELPAASAEQEPLVGPPARTAASTRPVGGHPATVVPFDPPPDLRRPDAGDALPAFWADGGRCSIGCRPFGAGFGWPVRPFHAQHPLRAGLNELRTGSLHIGVDIQAGDNQAVYAVQSGSAAVPVRTGGDSRVRVGSYEYWHVIPAVSPGQRVVAYRTIVGRVRSRYGHVHLSELAGGHYVNPMRPGGRVLSPYSDRAPPVIGVPEIHGRLVDVRAYDPQSLVAQTPYVTPVLAPAALAYRLRASDGRAIGGLQFALRGSQLHPYSQAPRIYMPDARPAGFLCFAFHPRCTPNWHYHLAGGLAPPLPALGSGVYLLTVYAWDWAGNASALDSYFTVG